jgi:predicted metal-dependent peptidase
MDLDKRLSKAKASLILEHPFIGTIAMNMPFELSEQVPTAATNGKRVYFNPEFISPLTDEELKFLVAHECMHPMLDHCYRRLARDPFKFNIAGDIIINDLLVEDNIGKMPEGGCYDKELWNAGGGTTDGVYAKLPDDEGGGGGSGEGPGAGWQDCEDAEGTQQQQDQESAKWKVKVAQAAQAAKMMGKMSASMEKLVDEMLNPKVDWREVLQRFVEKCRNDYRSWARPNRRFIPQGVYLPSLDGVAMGELVVAVDCSGSCWDDIPQFGNEVRTIHEDQKPKAIHVVYFDSSVSHYEHFTQDDEFHMEGHGGGGTAFSPIFEYVAENNIEPVACVVLTDLCCSDFGPQPEYPVLWVSNHSDQADWGEVVMM